MNIRGRGLWERVDELVVGALVAVAMLGAAYFGAGPLHRSEQLPGMFEGQGAVTIGCALWDVPLQGEAYEGDPKDFLVQADREEFLMLYSLGGRMQIVSGKQCGYSVDHRVFPEEERKHDKRAEGNSGSSSNR